jgi:hypothetical protein
MRRFHDRLDSAFLDRIGRELKKPVKSAGCAGRQVETRFEEGWARGDVWQDRLARFESSGRTVLDFCRAEGTSTASFYLWRKNLGGSLVVATRRRASRVLDGRPPRPAFVPVRLDAAASVEIEHADQCRMRIPAGEVDLITAVVAALGRLSSPSQAGTAPC